MLNRSLSGYLYNLETGKPIMAIIYSVSQTVIIDTHKISYKQSAFIPRNTSQNIYGKL